MDTTTAVVVLATLAAQFPIDSIEHTANETHTRALPSRLRLITRDLRTHTHTDTILLCDLRQRHEKSRRTRFDSTATTSGHDKDDDDAKC